MNTKREDLLNRLDDPDTLWEEMLLILDQLDEEEGAIPFDTQAGWDDLMARTDRKKWTWRKVPLAAVIALVCLVSTVAAGSFGLHEKLADFFGAGEEQTALLEEGVSQPKAVMLPGAIDGVNIEILQVVADQAGIYALYEATIPKQIPLPEDVTWREAVVQPQTQSGTAFSMGHKVLSVGGNTITGLLNTFGFRSVLVPGRVSAHFEDLGYWEGENFVPLLEGEWHLYWKLKEVALGATIALDQPIREEAVLTELTLSPVSVRLEVTGGEIDAETLFLEFRDGTRQPVFQVGSPAWGRGWDLLADTTRIYSMFEEPIDPEQVTAVVIEGSRIPLP